MRLFTLLSLVVGLAIAWNPAIASSDTVDRVLNAHRSAMGGPPAGGARRVVYSYAGQGMTGTVTSRFDVATGAYVTESDLGVIHVASGFDGAMPWMRDISGANTPQDGGDRVRLGISEAYRNANAWWRPDRGGATISEPRMVTTDRETTWCLTVTPPGGSTFDACFDVETGLLVRIAERQMFFNTRTFYSEYARRDGDMLPMRIVVDGGTGEENYATMGFVSASSGAALPLSAYSRPTEAPTGVTIQGGDREVTLPFRLLNNHIYIEGSVEGRGPYTFIVDTGGHTILSSKVVREAGLASAGAAASSGAGEKTTTSGYAPVHEIAFGPIRMHDQTAITMDIYDPAVEGIAVDGMVGFELFRRLAVRIDYGKGLLTFSRFEDFDARDAGVEVPFTFYDHIPQVEGRIGDLPVLLDIDTGSRNEVNMTSPFVAAHDLTGRYPGGVTAMTGWGVGGPSMSQVVRAPSLSLGPVVVERPVVGMSTATAGSFSDANFGGNVGSGLLKRFVTSFDYSRQRMYLQRIEPAPIDAGTFDRSGMWLNAGPDGFVIAYVSSGGAAESAGLAAGDIVTRIDGHPAVAESLSAIRALLRTHPAGSDILVTVVREGAARTATLTLKDLV